MGNVALSAPSVIVNNQTIAIVPNSLKYDGGEGEISVRAASAGGGSITTVHTVNVETKIGKVMFDVYPDTEIDALISQWKENVGGNSIQAIQVNNNGKSVTLAWDNMSLVNSVERQASADGVVSLEFNGDPMAIQ